MTQMPVPQPTYSAADFDRTLILALEVSEKSWVVAAQVPGLPGSKPRRTLSPTAEALLEAVETYRARAARAGRIVDRVVLVYNEFRSVMSQRVVVDQLLPIVRADVDTAAPSNQVDYLYEPSPQEIFNELLPRYIEAQVYRALLESNAAFFAAQMTAMDTATKNSADMISSLTLYMNKVRQAAITREIIEVVSGAQAL